MKKKKSNKRFSADKKIAGSKKQAGSPLAVLNQLQFLKKHLDKLRSQNDQLHERVQDTEIHIALLIRFLTIICIEKLGMRIGVLKRLLKKIEKDAIRESQINHLESLYQIAEPPPKKPPPPSSASPEKDPWDDVS